MNMKITVCIGSSCHIKGAREVVENIQKLITEFNLVDFVELSGTFCMGKCRNGVSVTVNEELFSVTPGDEREFFVNNVVNKLN